MLNMDALMIAKIANEIVNETILFNWKFYVLLVLITFITTCISSFVFPYLKTRGKAFATEVDFKALLKQLEKTTETTETIKRAITYSDWALKEQKLLRRTKLEELLSALFEVEDWTSKCTVEQVFSELIIEKPKAFYKVRLISQLYFNELENEMKSLNDAFNKILVLVLTARKDSLVNNYESESITKALEKPMHQTILQNLQERSTNLHKKNIDDIKIFSDNFIENYKVFNNAIREVEEKARELMNSIINVDYDL